MTNTAADFVKKAVDLREAGRSAEAVIAARRATAMDETSANAWWQLALALVEEKGEEEACSAFEKTVDLAPSYSYGWHRLGLCYKKIERLEDAIGCWEEAIELSDERYDSMRYLVFEYKQRQQDGDDGRIFDILKRLDDAGQLKNDATNKNRLGIAYYDRGEYFNAIYHWKSYVKISDDESGYFNLGLAHDAIRQSLDAIDYWRRTLALNSQYKRALERIEKVSPRLIALGERVVSNGRSLLSQDRWYDVYINPIELLALDDLEAPWPLDAKTFQKSKKLLFQEIDLEDGKVEWMPGLKLDRSRAIKVLEGLDDSDVGYYHYQVYENKPLLDFLSKGSLELFIIDPDESPIDLLSTIDSDYDFTVWLSDIFRKQFDNVFSYAVDNGFIDEIEILLSGRRWVLPYDEDKCFESSRRTIDRLIEPIRNARDLAKQRKPAEQDVKKIINKDNFSDLIAKLPVSFQDEKIEVASLLRGISIDCYNIHDDADLAMSMLNLSLPFVEGVPSLNHQFKEDKEALADRVREAHKDEVFLNIAGAPHNITSAGVKFGSIEINNESVESIRWGVLISQERGLKKHSFSMAINGSGSRCAKIEWYAIDNIEEQEKLFNKLVDAVFSYIIPTVMDKVKRAIDSGEIIRIGGVQMSKDGVTFTLNGWLGSKSHLCPWSRVRADLSNGELVLSDPNNSKAKTSMPLRETDNAFVLYMMAK